MRALALLLPVVLTVAACADRVAAPQVTEEVITETSPPSSDATKPGTLSVVATTGSALVRSSGDLSLEISVVVSEWKPGASTPTPRGGVALEFTVTRGSGTLTLGQAITDASGIARTTLHYPLNEAQEVVTKRADAPSDRDITGVVSCDAQHFSLCEAYRNEVRARAGL